MVGWSMSLQLHIEEHYSEIAAHILDVVFADW